MRGKGKIREWYKRKLARAKAPGPTNRVLRRVSPEHLHGLISAAMSENSRVPPLTDFLGETTEAA